MNIMKFIVRVESKPSVKDLRTFENKFWRGDFPNKRYGQAACSWLDLPKELEDKIFYEQDIFTCQMDLRRFIQG